MSNRRTWTKEQLVDAVSNGFSYASVLRGLNLKPTGGNYQQVKKYIQEYNLDISHFTGQGWSAGRVIGTKVNVIDKLKLNTHHNSNRLRKQLISSNILEEKCSICKLDKWMGNKIPLELDHINGIRTDNRIENLQIVCPNCHALTPTYRGKNIKSQ